MRILPPAPRRLLSTEAERAAFPGRASCRGDGKFFDLPLLPAAFSADFEGKAGWQGSRGRRNRKTSPQARKGRPAVFRESPGEKIRRGTLFLTRFFPAAPEVCKSLQSPRFRFRGKAGTENRPRPVHAPLPEKPAGRKGDPARGRIKKARGRRIPVPVRCYLNTSMPFSCSSYILPYQRLMK